MLLDVVISMYRHQVMVYYDTMSRISYHVKALKVKFNNQFCVRGITSSTTTIHEMNKRSKEDGGIVKEFT